MMVRKAATFYTENEYHLHSSTIGYSFIHPFGKYSLCACQCCGWCSDGEMYLVM